MAKESKKLIKKITTNQLAEMINSVMNKMATKEQVDNLEIKVDKIEARLGNVEKKLDTVISRTDKLETKMDYVENILSIKK